MIPLTKESKQLLDHIFGINELPLKKGKKMLTEAVNLDNESTTIISTFGKKEFSAITGFIDMRGFSTKAKGKPPIEVLEIAKPFVDVIIEVAKNRHWIIDKTIGDEVMVICPFSNYDDISNLHVNLPRVQNYIEETFYFVSELIKAINNRNYDYAFSCGFATGKIILDQVGATGFCEWTCYGNSINTAKRLACIDTPPEIKNNHWFVMGSSEYDNPYFSEEINVAVNCLNNGLGKLELLSPIIEFEELKGVGKVSYVKSCVNLSKGI